tara:strand:+ start:73 stop:444 length:372 start_codon:yes stop_codon:yes gene_type:complete
MFVLYFSGFEISVFDKKDGKDIVRKAKLGNMVIKTSLPPGSLHTLFNNDERYVENYLTKFPGYYDTGDAAFIDEDGYISIMGRTDDIINIAGHRLSTGTMEEILLEHPKIVNCAKIERTCLNR